MFKQIEKESICDIEKINQPLIQDIKINNIIKLGANKFHFIKKIGKPDNIYREYDEVFDLKIDVLKYNNSKFYFEKNKLNSFEIKDEKFLLQINDLRIRVGNNECGTNSKNSTYMKQIQNYDQYLMFEVVDGKVLKICMWEP
ncbi:MAG: hypothetical protein LBP34_06030 [Flavobacteriaceae bacterium]|jgi:hypothetical protein|nr:hypothetical protein [Flavobacteriaceae bacterium]